MSNEFLDYVEDIIEAMEKAEVLLEGITYTEFVSDFRTNLAIVRLLEIIGEATKRLPLSFRSRYSHIPWKEMAGMRDIIIHSYDKVNLRTVWDTVKNRVPIVKPQLQQILSDYQE
jgi:uncharacterized protein with HEPN domain